MDSQRMLIRVPEGTPPRIQPGESTERMFQRLAADWRDETEFLSSVTAKAMHRAYQRIIGMGEKAVPLILRELAREPDHWFWALEAITGDNPVPPGDEGRMDAMAEAWLRYGRARGYVR